MGQQNQKVLFEGHRQTYQKRRNIFGHDRKQKQPLEICQIPGCRCSLPHPEFNTKVCSNCQQSPPPFLKTKNKPIYYEQSHYLEQPKTAVESPTKHIQIDEAERIPSKISYFNAWSLPTQQYYIKQKSAFNAKGKSIRDDESIVVSQRRQNVDSFLHQVTQKVARAADAPKIEFQRRKQNMNLSD